MSKTLLSQKAKALADKRTELGELFAKHKSPEGEYQMDAAVLADVRGRSEELDRMQSEFDGLKATVEIEEKNSRELDRSREVKRPPAGAGAENGGSQEGGQPDGKSLGQHFVESRAFKEFSGGRSPAAEADLDVKTLMTTSAGWAPQSLRTGFVLLSPQQMPKVVDLLPKTETGFQLVKYMEETTFTNNAAETAEAGAYPESAFAMTERQVAVQKVAVFLPVTDEQFEDEPRARDYVNNRLGFQLQQRLDQQILTGDGNAPNLKGIHNVGSINTQAKSTDPPTDAVYKGITKIRTTGFTEPSGVVMNPTDWQNLRLLRTADGIYLWGNPSDDVLPRIFGLPIVATTYQTLGTAVVGDFANFSELSLRRGVEFEVSNSHSDYFTNGKLAIRASFRCAVIWYRPKAFCEVTGL